MDDPHKASSIGDSDGDPDHYIERYRGTGDNNGVHVNAGIPNKAFYLLAKGGTHHRGGSMTGIGADDAAKIWYKALTTYMTQTTNFAGARVATENAATVLFGLESVQLAAVKQAWCLVGVGVCGSEPPAEPPVELQNNVPVSGLSGSAGSQLRFFMTVPAGATNLSFKIMGGTGDADLYMKFGSSPTLTNYDCRSWSSGNTETCSQATPTAGDYFTLINGYTNYSGLTLVGSFTVQPTLTEYITNGGFERTIAPWTLAGDAVRATDFSAHGGFSYVKLGQRNAVAQVAQSLTVPTTAKSANLTFYLNVVSDETGKTSRDQLFVEIRSNSGKLLQTIATYSNLNKGTIGSYTQVGSFNLMKYRGQTVKLQFRTAIDNRLPTTFRIDDVSVK